MFTQHVREPRIDKVLVVASMDRQVLLHQAIGLHDQRRTSVRCDLVERIDDVTQPDMKSRQAVIATRAASAPELIAPVNPPEPANEEAR